MEVFYLIFDLSKITISIILVYFFGFRIFLYQTYSAIFSFLKFLVCSLFISIHYYSLVVFYIYDADIFQNCDYDSVLWHYPFFDFLFEMYWFCRVFNNVSDHAVLFMWNVMPFTLTRY